VAALKPSAYLGTKVGGGASGATSQLSLTLIRSKEAQSEEAAYLSNESISNLLFRYLSPCQRSTS